MKNPEYRIEKHSSFAFGDEVFVFRNLRFPEAGNGAWRAVSETVQYEATDLVPKVRGLGWLLGYKERTRPYPVETRRNFDSVEAAQEYIRREQAKRKARDPVQIITVCGDGTEEWDPPKEDA